jgi:hypothetical protein
MVDLGGGYKMRAGFGNSFGSGLGSGLQELSRQRLRSSKLEDEIAKEKREREEQMRREGVRSKEGLAAWERGEESKGSDRESREKIAAEDRAGVQRRAFTKAAGDAAGAGVGLTVPVTSDNFLEEGFDIEVTGSRPKSFEEVVRDTGVAQRNSDLNKARVEKAEKDLKTSTEAFSKEMEASKARQEVIQDLAVEMREQGLRYNPDASLYENRLSLADQKMITREKFQRRQARSPMARAKEIVKEDQIHAMERSLVLAANEKHRGTFSKAHETPSDFLTGITTSRIRDMLESRVATLLSEGKSDQDAWVRAYAEIEDELNLSIPDRPTGPTESPQDLFDRAMGK